MCKPGCLPVNAAILSAKLVPAIVMDKIGTDSIAGGRCSGLRPESRATSGFWKAVCGDLLRKAARGLHSGL